MHIIVGLRAHNAGVECGVEFSPMRDCVNTATLDGRSFLCLTFFSVLGGVGLVGDDGGAGGPA